MKMKKSVSAMDVINMRELRSQGFTNTQIAEAMGLSVRTIYRYIGLQPDGLRANWGAYSAKVTDVESQEGKYLSAHADSIQKTEQENVSVQEPPTEPLRVADEKSVVSYPANGILKLTRRVETYQGQFITYKMDNEGKLRIENDQGMYFDLNSDEAETFILELLEVSAMLNKAVS